MTGVEVAHAVSSTASSGNPRNKCLEPIRPTLLPGLHAACFIDVARRPTPRKVSRPGNVEQDEVADIFSAFSEAEVS